MKYARRELERRFLCDAVPPGEPTARAHIVDRYIHGTTLRLRRLARDGEPTAHKLTQKRDGYITTIYLDAHEHERFAALPADVLEKARLWFPPLVVDVIEPDIVIAEVELDSAEELARFRPPPWVGREITGDPAWTGAALASPSRPRRPHPSAP